MAALKKVKGKDRGEEYNSSQSSALVGSSALDKLKDASGSVANTHVVKDKLNTLMHIIRSCEEYNDNALVTAGTFENYLKTRSNDPTFVKTQRVSEWLSFGDQLDYFNMSSWLWICCGCISIFSSWGCSYPLRY